MRRIYSKLFVKVCTTRHGRIISTSTDYMYTQRRKTYIKTGLPPYFVLYEKEEE